MFARVLSALRRFRQPGTAEVERDYLNGAVSLADLERRMREVDRGKFRRPLFTMQASVLGNKLAGVHQS